MEQQKLLERNIIRSYFGSFFYNLLFDIPIWVAFQRQFLSFTQMSLIAAMQIVIALMLELPTGAFADIFGRKKSVLMGCFVLICAYLRLAFAHGGLDILLGFLLSGIGSAFISGADVAFLFDNLKKLRKEKDFPKIRARGALIAQLGIVIASAISGFMYTKFKGLPYLGMVCSFGILASIWFFMHEEKQERKIKTIRDYLQHTKEGIRHTFANGFTRQLSIFYILVGGFSWVWQSFLNQIYASSIGYSEIGKGILFAVIRLTNVILIARFLHFKKLVTKKNIFIFFPVLLIISSLPAIIPSKGLGTTLLFFMTMSSTMRFILLDGFINEEFSSHYRATALSTLNMIIRIIDISVIMLSGPILDRMPAGVVYFIMGILTLILIVPKGIVLSKHEKSQPVNPSIVPNSTLPM